MNINNTGNILNPSNRPSTGAGVESHTPGKSQPQEGKSSEVKGSKEIYSKESSHNLRLAELRDSIQSGKYEINLDALSVIMAKEI
jgi:anti-sigma28 factor (negative regulator of flagellin synthesis)